tara:strand:+ start:27466 stop:28062 length:597 start_codon:yes stop_codon:yes gene_type:complete
MSGCDRKQFEEKYSISANTLRFWENPRGNSSGISPKGAQKLISALDKAGVSCAANWILEGAGSPPTLLNEMETTKEDHDSWIEDEAILREVDFFRKNNPDSTTLIVSDDSLEPWIKLGDYVGGIHNKKNKISHYYGKICILRTSNYGTLVRKVGKNKNTRQATLFSTNPNSHICPIIHDADINWIAEVIWVRRKSGQL